VSDLTLATNPVKIYEYLAAGKPCVATDLPEMSQFGDLVRCAADHAAFEAQLGLALSEKSLPDSEALMQRRQDFAQQQTWAHRAQAVLDVKNQISTHMPLISVIVLTYNNLDLSKACLESLLNKSDYAQLEIIVVDNASSDGTQAYLEQLALQEPRIRCILNSDNLGFAAGNNIGLAQARGEYLVVLNNDTVVTQGWALGMLRHFQTNPHIGLLGPVTNNIGNEAKLHLQYTDLADMPREARAATLAAQGATFAIRTLAFFCVMLPRKVYEQCGGLCEDYGLGFFEDDDYCRRVEEHGLQIRCAQDVFVHHHLSASFSKLGDEKRQALFERNRAIYEAKWGAWEPHQYKD
jgi:O-antigen biosynthesis protein